MAGYDWLSCFSERNNKLIILQAERLSIFPTECMNSEYVNDFVFLLVMKSMTNMHSSQNRDMSLTWMREDVS